MRARWIRAVWLFEENCGPGDGVMNRYARYYCWFTLILLGLYAIFFLAIWSLGLCGVDPEELPMTLLFTLHFTVMGIAIAIVPLFFIDIRRRFRNDWERILKWQFLIMLMPIPFAFIYLRKHAKEPLPEVSQVPEDDLPDVVETEPNMSAGDIFSQ